MNVEYSFDYYYGAEAEQFVFYRIPKVLFTDKKFKDLSNDAKILYGLMLDRLGLSLKHGWFDGENRAYIHYTLESIMEDLNCAREKCVKVLAELDSKKGIGLIEKKRQGLGKPDQACIISGETHVVKCDYYEPVPVLYTLCKDKRKESDYYYPGPSVFINDESGDYEVGFLSEGIWIVKENDGSVRLWDENSTEAFFEEAPEINE